MSLDGGFAYIAGHCGLVPVLGENYREWRASLWVSLGHEHEGEEVMPFSDKMMMMMTIFDSGLFEAESSTPQSEPAKLQMWVLGMFVRACGG